MKCSLCKHGETRQGTVTVTLERGESVVVLRQVPAAVCDNCGEYYLAEEITEQVMSRAEDAVKRGAVVEVLRFAA